jgi:hypothetical protein
MSTVSDWVEMEQARQSMREPGGTQWWAPVLPVPVFGMASQGYSWVTCMGRPMPDSCDQ